MIELIFVIVILGILASVAIPKLMGTTTDAKIVAISKQIRDATDEIRTYAVSTGSITDLKTMSHVLSTLIKQAKAKDTKDSWTGWNNAFSSHIITSGLIDSCVIGTQDGSGNMEDCVLMEINATTLVIKDNNASNLGAICKGVIDKVENAFYTIGGSKIKF